MSYKIENKNWGNVTKFCFLTISSTTKLSFKLEMQKLNVTTASISNSINLVPVGFIPKYFL